MTSENAELTACALCSGTVWLSLVFARQYSLKKLFSYHGWMYEIRGKISLRTKLWMVFLTNYFHLLFKRKNKLMFFI